MNLTGKETFFILDGESDKKNMLLRSNAILTEEEVQRIVLKNRKVITKLFSQSGYHIPDYQQWNSITPSHAAKDTARLDDAVIERYINEGAVFSL